MRRRTGGTARRVADFGATSRRRRARSAEIALCARRRAKNSRIVTALVATRATPAKGSALAAAQQRSVSERARRKKQRSGGCPHAALAPVADGGGRGGALVAAAQAARRLREAPPGLRRLVPRRPAAPQARASRVLRQTLRRRLRNPVLPRQGGGHRVLRAEDATLRGRGAEASRSRSPPRRASRGGALPSTRAEEALPAQAPGRVPSAARWTRRSSPRPPSGLPGPAERSKRGPRAPPDRRGPRAPAPSRVCTSPP